MSCLSLCPQHPAGARHLGSSQWHLQVMKLEEQARDWAGGTQCHVMELGLDPVGRGGVTEGFGVWEQWGHVRVIY